jgi:hypothetical protein
VSSMFSAPSTHRETRLAPLFDSIENMNSPDKDVPVYIGMRWSINFNLKTIETSSVRYLVS